MATPELLLAAAVFSLDRVTASLDPLNTLDPLNSLDPLNTLDELDTILHNYKHSVLTDQEVELFDEAVNSVEGDTDSARSRARRARRARRAMPTMYMDKKKKMRTCANMNGILGGSNAFNYVSFVLAILTLVVNTNNNLNNNNNNLNQANLNTASNNNANANSNNNNANVINVMPPGKKKRRRRRRKRSPHPFDVFEDRICVKSQQSSVSGELSLAAMLLVQGYLRSLTSDRCRQQRLCRSLAEAARLGLGGRLLVTAVRAAAAATEAVELDCDDDDTTEEESGEGCDGDGEEAEHKIQCAQCGHTVSTSSDIVNIHTDHALSSG